MSEVRDFIVGLNERKIAGIRLVEDHTLQIELDNGDLIEACDEGQACCEHRYMTTDDDLEYFVGSELVDIEIRNGGYQDEGWDVHEVEFLLITTSLGVFTIENHNEHNGYYGGFNVVIRFRKFEIANVYTVAGEFSGDWDGYELKKVKYPW